MKRFRLFTAFSHLSRAAKKQEGEEGETGAETQGNGEYAGAREAVKKGERTFAPQRAIYVVYPLCNMWRTRGIAQTMRCSWKVSEGKDPLILAVETP